MKAAELPIFYNASSILEDNLDKRANKIALYSAIREVTFQTLVDEVNQVGNALLQSGVRFGDPVGILVPDSAEWVTTFFGAIKIGAVVVCMNTLLQSHEYDYILRDSRLCLLVVHESLLAQIEPIRDQHPFLQQVVVIGQSHHPTDISFAAWHGTQPTVLSTALTHRDDFCTLHYSSGTTGQPKGMFHAHKDYPLVAHNTSNELFDLTETDRTFSTAKLFFTYGLSCNLMIPWSVGAAIVLDAGSPRIALGVLKTIDRFKPTIFYSVPTVYTNLLTIPDIAKRYDLSSVRLCISAGEALPAVVWQKWQEQTDLAILDMLGCTETIHKILANRLGDLRPGSSGKPLSAYPVRLVDEAGHDLPPNKIGTLLVKSEATVFSYLHQAEKSRQVFQGEWFITGDQYYRDADGFYWHAGRGDDMFKVGGLWVSPVEVENLLLTHPAVLECAVVGLPDAQTLTKPKAFIHLREGYATVSDLLNDLLDHCSESLPDYKCPRWIDFVTELPRTATGKIQRYKLRTKENSR